MRVCVSQPSVEELRALSANAAPPIEELTSGVLSEAKNGKGQADSPRFSAQAPRLALKLAGGLILIRTEEVDWVEAEKNYVLVHAGPWVHRVRSTLKAMQLRLPGSAFVRISRFVIVQIDRVTAMERTLFGDYDLTLANRTRLTLGRRYQREFKRATGCF